MDYDPGKLRKIRHSREFKERQRRQELNKVLVDIARAPTSGYHKLSSGSQHAARSRAKAFYPFD